MRGTHQALTCRSRPAAGAAGVVVGGRLQPLPVYYAPLVPADTLLMPTAAPAAEVEARLAALPAMAGLSALRALRGVCTGWRAAIGPELVVSLDLAPVRWGGLPRTRRHRLGRRVGSSRCRGSGWRGSGGVKPLGCALHSTQN